MIRTGSSATLDVAEVFDYSSNLEMAAATTSRRLVEDFVIGRDAVNVRAGFVVAAATGAVTIGALSG